MSGFLKSLFGRSKAAVKLAEPVKPPSSFSPSQAPDPPAPDRTAEPPKAHSDQSRIVVPDGPRPEAEPARSTPERASEPSSNAVSAEPDPEAALHSAVQGGDLEETLRLGEALRAARPDVWIGYVLPARALRHQGRIEEAEALLGQAPDLTMGLPPDLLTLITRTELAEHQRRYPEMAERARVMLDAFPDHAISSILTAVAARGLGDLAAAERILGEARARFPKDLVVLIIRAEIARDRADWRYAALRAAELRDAFPDRGAGYAIGAEALRYAGREADAEALMEQAVELLREDRGLATQWAERALAAQDWDAAERRAALVRKRFPGEPDGYTLGVRAMRGAQDSEQAKTLVAQGMTLSRPDPSLYAAWAELAIDNKDWSEADAATTRMRKEFPHFWLSWFLSARTLMLQDRDGEAEPLLRAGRARIEPERVVEGLWTELALRRQDWQEAETRAAHARTIFPAEANPFAQGVRSLLGAERFEEAEALGREGLERFPGHGHLTQLAAEAERAREAADASPTTGPGLGDEHVRQTLAEGRFDSASQRWHAMTADEHTPFDAVLDAALRITLATPWHDSLRPMFETLGAEHTTGASSWTAVVEQAPLVAISPEQFQAWREASAAFLQDADPAVLDADTRARWLALVD